MSDEEEKPKKVVEVSDGDSIIVLHADQTISLYEGDNDMTTFYVNMLQFILTDEELLPELEEIYLEKMGMSGDQAEAYGEGVFDFIPDFDSSDDDEDEEKPKFPKLPKPDPGKKWKPHELN